ncbi:MAG: hypothetical protein IKC50_02755 [Oscillospiraceae bacterium]|nr:hypothetical protein [Oscillospiraceae bacterium]
MTIGVSNDAEADFKLPTISRENRANRMVFLMPEKDNIINNEQEINVRKLMDVALRNIHWLALAALVCGIVAWLYSAFLITPMYTSTATLYTHNAAVNLPDSNRQTVTYNELYAAEELSGPYITILTSDSLLNKTIRSLHLPDVNAASLRKCLSVKTDDNKLVITVSMTREDPREAQAILDRLLHFYPDEIERVIHSGGSEVIDGASLPVQPSSPNVMRNAVISAFAGFLLALAYFVINSLVNEVVTDEESIASDFGLPVLGAIPQIELREKEVGRHEKK